MSHATKVAVLGAGSFGTALANVFADAGHEVTLWGRDASLREEIRTRHENPKYLPGIRLSERIGVAETAEEAIGRAEGVVCAIPTQAIRPALSKLAGPLAGKILVNLSKGIELGTNARVSEIVQQVAPQARYAVLSGPSFALEVAQRLPTAVTIASPDADCVAQVQQWVATPYFRAYRSSDVIGVELAGAVKNVIAIAAGMVTGLKLGYNAQAAIINRGVAEVARLGRNRGAQPMTFLGLSGMGDLVLTCTGPLSRNRRVGVALGEGKKLDVIQRELGGVAEGVYTARSAFEYSRSHGVEMPITEQVYRILYEGSTAQKALTALMSRDLKEEWT